MANKIKKFIAFVFFIYIVLCVACSSLLSKNLFISYISTMIIFGYLVYFFIDIDSKEKEDIKNQYLKQIQTLQDENKFIYSLMNKEQKKQIYLKNQESFNQYLNDFHNKVIESHKK